MNTKENRHDVFVEMLDPTTLERASEAIKVVDSKANNLNIIKYNPYMIRWSKDQSMIKIGHEANQREHANTFSKNVYVIDDELNLVSKIEGVGFGLTGFEANKLGGIIEHIYNKETYEIKLKGHFSDDLSFDYELEAGKHIAHVFEL